MLGCKLEIFGILLIVDLRVMNMSEFNVILGMDWLAAYRVIIDCEKLQWHTCIPYAWWHRVESGVGA